MWPLIELKLHTNLISLDLFHLPHPQADSPEFSSPRSDRMLSPGFSDSPHRAQQAVPFHRLLVPYYGPRPIASLLRWTSQSSLQPTNAPQWSICSNLQPTDAIDGQAQDRLFSQAIHRSSWQQTFRTSHLGTKPLPFIYQHCDTVLLH